MFDDVVATYREQSSDASIGVDVDALDGIGDSRLGLALSELVDNALAHCGDDVEVRIASRPEHDRVLLTVADDGPGIPERERAVVSGSVEITQLDHGSGLGLWIVKWVCEACGGRVRFEESPPGGASVVLSLTPTDGERGA